MITTFRKHPILTVLSILWLGGIVVLELLRLRGLMGIFYGLYGLSVYAVGLTSLLISGVFFLRWTLALAARRTLRASAFIHFSFLLSSLFVLFLASLAFNITRLPSGSGIRAFDSSMWNSDEGSNFNESGRTLRQEMLEDTLKKAVVGKTRDEVSALLGPGSPNLLFGRQATDLLYDLGMERDNFIAVDGEWLLIEFEADGKFKQYAVRND